MWFLELRGIGVNGWFLKLGGRSGVIQVILKLGGVKLFKWFPKLGEEVELFRWFIKLVVELLR